MMFHFKCGFTLIELLVVLIILSTTMSLVAPFAVNSVARMEARTELFKFERKLKELHNEAFFSGGSINVVLENHVLDAVYPSGRKEQIIFSHINFPLQKKSIPVFIANDQLVFEVRLGEESYAVSIK